ncbi:hypothetical protein BBJ28_00008024 [Nothophytophthora sp. Chile5]|nr:hypothetical protein BBJ28_00008024 [Nothophytophthora sp. Chile5]
MVLGRSYWELPPDLQAQVMTPMLDAMRQWDPEGAEQKYGAAQQWTASDEEELRRKREEAVAKSRTAMSSAHVAPSVLNLDERMAQAAQKQKAAAEVLNSANGGSSNHRLEGKSSSDAKSSSEYLELVRQLQPHDEKEADGTGSKWLVR